MCFNATLTTPIEVAQKIYNLKVKEVLEYSLYGENRNAFSHPFLPIVVENRNLTLGKWGLIPRWVNGCDKATEISKYTLNARVETVREKPSFKYSVDSDRVIVIIDGFYEWKHLGRKKIPYYISADKPLLIAGLKSIWSGFNTFSLITTSALGIMKEIHNSKERMPFFISEDDMDIWLNSKIPFSDVIEDVLPKYDHISAVERSPN